jgi:hypothetical protein
MMLRPLAFAATFIAAAMFLGVLTGPEPAGAAQVCESIDTEEWCTSLSPDPDTNPVGASHTVTLDMTHPAGAVDTMAILVYSGPNAGESIVGTPTPGDPDLGSHSLSLTYTGDGGTGTDQIIGIVCTDVSVCNNMVQCMVNDPACAQTVQGDCTVNNFNTLTRLAGGGVSAGVTGICFGDATASKAWQSETAPPSASPTPSVGAGGQSPSPTPTPAGLPATGGSAGDNSGPGAWVIALAAAVVATAGGFFAVRRWRASS